MALTQHEFAFVSGLVRREAAIVLESGKEYLVEARLLPLARRTGTVSVSEFVARAQRERVLADQIVDALTTNETSWLRDREPFTAFTDSVVPDLAERRGPQHKLRIWSAACSSGQEPYSLAMLLEESVRAGKYEIIATDISTEMIERAKAGRYSQLEVNRGLPVPMLVRYFDRVGTEWQVAEALRRNISFQKVNLAAPLPQMAPFDVVFLRNVLIYFDLETKRSVLRRIRSLMRPDGWLFLGAAETTIGIDDGFERVVAGRASAYRPRAATTAPVGATRKG
ncbi:chemotaxis protein methyltransferase [Planomonospora parontospora subsp. parontospora]|uniref:protein-glutamate O-methyltransferase n=2 Tax=Planomonospora parontospora TaxID=58119 RepID=A0AA37BN59_9ACTN|nr:protein-glutamate O-methyltransferase CheR [Planomonospora parontospora]GGK95823.1 chemotaxis protein methyltransferase [Planomonospora parontospora]GII12999.1 chemotaxis protein methyltransferase [Planomonospora parontospora subsp. parontospora]